MIKTLIQIYFDLSKHGSKSKSNIDNTEIKTQQVNSGIRVQSKRKLYLVLNQIYCINDIYLAAGDRCVCVVYAFVRRHLK